MKSKSIAACGVFVGLFTIGCTVQDQNHPIKTQSYHQMGDQGYNLKRGQGGSTHISNQGEAKNLTQMKLSEDYDLHLSSTLEVKLNRAGITSYNVLAGRDQVLLGLSYTGKGGEPYNPNEDRAQWNSQQTQNTEGFGTAADSNSPMMDKGFGSPTSPQLNKSTNQINGIPVKELEKTANPNAINNRVDKTNQIPVNPGLGQTSRVGQSSQTDIYKARDIILKQMGNDVDVIVVDDPAGIEAISRIKQKLSTRGTARAESITNDVRTIENSINK